MRQSVALAVALILCCIAPGVYAQDQPEVHQFTADQAVEYALKHSLQVQNALLDIKAQQMQNKQVTAAALPSLSASGGMSMNPNVQVMTFPNFIAQSTYAVLVANQVKKGDGTPITAPDDFGTINAGFATKWSLSGGVDLTQILFDGQVFVGLMARNAAVKNAELASEVTREQIKANVLKIYYQLAVGQQQISTIDANIKNVEQLLHDTKLIYQNGFAEKLDIDKVQVQLSNLQTQRLKAQNQIDAGVEALKFLLGMPMQDSLVLTESITDDKLKSNILGEEYHFEDRVDYQQLKNLEELNKLNVKRYQLSKLPTLVFAANYSKNAQRQSFDFFKGPYFTSSFLALRLNVPIFSGLGKNAQIESARITLRQTQNNLKLLESSITNDIRQSRLNMKTALYNMDTQKKNIELADQVYKTTKLKYEQGVGSNLEISSAQTELIMAQNNYYSSLYDAIIARIDFLKAAGKL
ncbi:MAG: TolC family protein [Chitinophagaceae bacterium]|nr:TolC family protein [Chitinophagaceae bacterium]